MSHLNIIFICLSTSFIVQNVKKKNPLESIQSYENASFLGPKQPVSPERGFFSENPSAKLVAFVHVYLYALNSDVNPLMRYYQLKKTEIWLAKSQEHFCPWLERQIFPTHFRVFQIVVRGEGWEAAGEDWKFCWGNFFTRWWEPEEEWFWQFLFQS